MNNTFLRSYKFAYSTEASEACHLKGSYSYCIYRTIKLAIYSSWLCLIIHGLLQLLSLNWSQFYKLTCYCFPYRPRHMHLSTRLCGTLFSLAGYYYGTSKLEMLQFMVLNVVRFISLFKKDNIIIIVS